MRRLEEIEFKFLSRRQAPQIRNLVKTGRDFNSRIDEG